MIDDQLYTTTGQWWSVGDTERPRGMAALVRIDDGRGIEVANTWDSEREHNPDGYDVATNPFGLAVGPDGNLWVADAAANDLLKIDPATGRTEVVAVFDGIPSPIPNAVRGGALESEPVPTGVTFDHDGNLYVSLLPGVPFLPGSAKVVKITPDGAVTDYATGLTMLTDLQTGPDGHLYAVSLAEFTEKGPTPASGEIVRGRVERPELPHSHRLQLRWRCLRERKRPGRTWHGAGCAVPGTGSQVRPRTLKRYVGQLQHVPPPAPIEAS